MSCDTVSVALIVGMLASTKCPTSAASARRHGGRVRKRTHEEDVRVLAQCVGDRGPEALSCRSRPPLGHDRPLVWMQHFDRVFHRDDVARLALVHVVEIAARVEVRPEPASPVTSTSPDVESARRFTPGGRLARVEARRQREDSSHHQPDPSPLAKRADAEPPRPGAEYTKSASSPSRKRSARRGGMIATRPAPFVGLDDLKGSLAQDAVDPQEGPGAHLKVDIGPRCSTA